VPLKEEDQAFSSRLLNNENLKKINQNTLNEKGIIFLKVFGISDIQETRCFLLKLNEKRNLHCYIIKS
jgi:hypothetical protein